MHDPLQSNHHYNEKRIIWEVWNEINLGREHDVSVEDYLAMYIAQVHAMTDGIGAFELGPTGGGPWKGTYSYMTMVANMSLPI